METFDEPFELVGDFLGAEVAGYTVLQIGVGLTAISGVMYFAQKGWRKLFNG